MSIETHIPYLRKALQHARDHSHDPRTQNGALVLGWNPADSEYFALGANHIPRRLSCTGNRLDPAVKLKYMEHAERAAIYQASKLGLALDGATMYCPWFACVECARAIMCSGIQRVVGLQRPRLLTPERWQATIAEADELLEEAGIDIELLDVEIGVEILFNGEKVVM